MDTKTRQHNWYVKNKERMCAEYKEKYQQNREEILASRAEKRKNEAPEAREKRLAYQKKYRAENAERSAARLQTDEYKYKQYSSAATKRDYNFDLSFERFQTLFHSACAYCGLVDSRGIDRVDNAIGYVPSNSVPCCELCNKMKWAYSKDDFISQAKRIAAFNTH